MSGQGGEVFHQGWSKKGGSEAGKIKRSRNHIEREGKKVGTSSWF
jgi:hypothetical protein